MPADQIAFIHEANTEVRKKELFSKAVSYTHLDVYKRQHLYAEAGCHFGSRIQ